MPNVKIGADISSFKSGITAAKSEVKTLDQQMKMIDATFKATGNSEEALSQKTQTLNSRMAAQKKMAEQAEEALRVMTAKGVDPASEAYQKMARTMLEAQTGMMETQASLNELGSGAVKAADGVGNLETGLNNIGKKVSLEQVISGIGRISNGLESAAKQAARIGKALMNETLGAASWADELATTAAAYGISTDQLQRMQKTAEIIDTSVNDILSARQKVAKSGGILGDLLGISTDGKSVEDLFWETGDAILAMGDALAQEEAAQKVFGRGWRELVPLFEAGRDEYERINGTWKTVSDEQLENLQKLDDQYQTLRADLETLKMETLGQLAEPMSKLVGALADILSSDQGKAVIDSAVGVLKDTIDWIVKNQGAAVTAIGAIAGAFTALKVSESVLTFVKLISGLKGLGGGNAGNAANASKGFTNSVFSNLSIGAMVPTEIDYGIDWAGKPRDYLNEILRQQGIDPPKLTADLQAESDAASKLTEQVGNVIIPATLEVTGISAGGQMSTTPGGMPGSAGGGRPAHYKKEYANGIPYVPDTRLAWLHKGERVTTAREIESRNYSSNLYVESMIMNNGTDAAGLASAMAAAQRRTMSGYGS